MISEVPDGTVHHSPMDHNQQRAAQQMIDDGSVALVTLAGGVGSRWSVGGGVVKGLNPFVHMGGRGGIPSS